MSNSLSTICVCGAGTMGTRIAETCAVHGFCVILFDINEQMLSAARSTITSDLQQLSARNKIDKSPEDILRQVQFTSNVAECRAGVIIEAVIEDLDTKINLLHAVAEHNAADTVYATNTSSLSVSAIASRFRNKENLAGMHFFNPATVMKLVEVVRTPFTSTETLDTITTVARRLGKTPVFCSDTPGFIVNRVARPFYLEALWLLEKNQAGIEMTDTLLESSGFKMGPFRLMDLIGNDINYSVSRIVYDALERPERLKPSVIQQQKVESGSLGRKTGKGYYDYPG